MRISVWWLMVLALAVVIAVVLALRQSVVNQPSPTAALPTANPAARPSPLSVPTAAPDALGTPAAAAPTSQAQERISALEAKLKANPADSEALVELGGIYFQLRQFPAAAEKFSAVLALQPDTARVRNDLASSLFYQGLLEEAKREYQRAIVSDGTLPDPHFNLGVIYSHSNPPDIPRALVEWREAVRLAAPDSEVARLAQGYLKTYETSQPPAAEAGPR